MKPSFATKQNKFGVYFCHKPHEGTIISKNLLLPSDKLLEYV
jgi:hypothetical protein